MTNYLDIYFITGTQDVVDGDLEMLLEKALKAGVTAFQYREKGENSLESDKEAYVSLAQKLQTICQNHNVPFIVNDDVDLAIELDADGVHVGQDDEDINSVINRFGKDKIVGYSTSNLEQVRAAKKVEHLSYIGIGPVFPSLSKSDTDPDIGIDGLAKLVVEAAPLKTVAIGGITANNAKDIRATGVDGLSVITAISRANNLNEAVQSLK